MGHRFIAPSVPDVRDRHHFEIQRTGVLHERWDESVPHAIGEAYHAHTHTIVRASDTCVTLRGKTERGAGQTKPSRFQKLPARSCSFIPAQLCRLDSSIVPAPRQWVSRLTARLYPSRLRARNCPIQSITPLPMQAQPALEPSGLRATSLQCTWPIRSFGNFS